jgi:hypothetical protein
LFTRLVVSLIGAVCLVAVATVAEATEWFVAPGGSGTGASTSPFGQIQAGLNAAQPGDVVTILPGTYSERLSTVRGGTSSARITLRAPGGRGSVLVTAAGRVLTVSHPFISVEALILDGQYGLDDLVRVAGGGDGFRLTNAEVRRSTFDLIDISAGADGVLIDKSLVHHALNAANGRTDAHGVAAGAVRDLTIRDTEIHTFSGDGVQIDPARSAPGWTGLTIERARIWLAPLPAPENGFPAGTVAGENAVDTKASPSYPRAVVVIRDTVASGFGGALITNAAAFNLKEHIDATVERVTVYNCEIAFRLRGAVSGGAWVAIRNAVVHDSLTAFRYEDDIQNLRIWNSTVGNGMTRAFQAASSVSSGLDVRNLLVLGTLPSQAAGPSNLAVGSTAFVNAAADNYLLAPTAMAIDAGVAIAGVPDDRNGVLRPQGASYDVGAYEYVGSGPNTPPAVNLTAPSEGASFVAPATLTISANASDTGGSITDVAFYANGVLVGRDPSSPYSIVVTSVPAGSHTLTAVATDNLLATTTSAPVRITVTTAPPPPPPPPATLTLTTAAHRNKGNQVTALSWTPAGPGTVAIYRDGAVITTGANDGAHTDFLNRNGSGTYIYKVCTVASPAVCSNESTVVF